MRQMINDYKKSCMLTKKRIDELTMHRNELRKNGQTDKIIILNLEQRIRLLYCEHRQMQEIISHLTNYMRRIELYAET